MAVSVTSQAAIGATRATSRGTAPAGWVWVCASLIPLLTTASWLVADAVQSAAYSPVRQSISVLAGHSGRDRWIVTTALLVVGCCYLLIADGLRQLARRARFGLLLTGLSAIGIALSPEPVHGSTPQHLAFTTCGAVLIAVWPLLAARTDAPWPSPTCRRVSGAVAALFIGLLVWTFIETRAGTTLGLAERLTSSAAICWPAVVAYAHRRQSAAGERVPSARDRVSDE